MARGEKTSRRSSVLWTLLGILLMLTILLGTIFLVRSWYKPQILPEAASVAEIIEENKTMEATPSATIKDFKTLCDQKGGKYLAYESYDVDFNKATVIDGIERYPSTKHIKIMCTIEQ